MWRESQHNLRGHKKGTVPRFSTHFMKQIRFRGAVLCNCAIFCGLLPVRPQIHFIRNSRSRSSSKLSAAPQRTPSQISLKKLFYVVCIKIVDYQGNVAKNNKTRFSIFYALIKHGLCKLEQCFKNMQIFFFFENKKVQE